MLVNESIKSESNDELIANNTTKTNQPPTIKIKLPKEDPSIKNIQRDRLMGASESIITHVNGASSSCFSVLFLINFNFGTKA